MNRVGIRNLGAMFTIAVFFLGWLCPPSDGNEMYLAVTPVNAVSPPPVTSLAPKSGPQLARVPFGSSNDYTIAASVESEGSASKPAVFVMTDANVRFGPGTAYAVSHAIKGGTAVNIIGRFDGWVEVFDGRQTGWVSLDVVIISDQFDLSSIAESSPELPESVVLSRFDAITIADVEIYDGPGRDYDVSGDVPEGALLHLAGRDADAVWVLAVDAIGEVGWLPVSALKIKPGLAVNTLAVATGPVTSSALGDFAFGAQTHDLKNPDLMQSMGMAWVKIQYKWRPDSKPTDVVERIAKARDLGFKVLLSTTGEPYPQRIEYAAFTAFLQAVAAQEPAPDAIEIWNEMNIDFEWVVGQIDPALYVNAMLAPGYEAIKSANPNIMVISGAPAPTGFHNGTNAWADDRYVAAMARAGAAKYLDCIGVHYNAGATSPYATTGHPAGGYYGWYFEPSLSMYHKAYGGTRPLCITEIGMLSGDGYGKLPENFWWAEQTTIDDQAQWLGEAHAYAQKLGYVDLMIVFSMDIHHWDDYDPQSGYALVRSDGGCPVCDHFIEREG